MPRELPVQEKEHLTNTRPLRRSASSRASDLNTLPEYRTEPEAAGNLAVQRLFRAGAIQAKLDISQAGDADEQEADRIADEVVSANTVGTVQRKCAACAPGATCPNCEEKDGVQRKEKSEHSPQVNSKAASQITCLQGGGEPLSSSVRAFFEPRLGRDFSRVRVHSNGSAAEAARAIHARAFTAEQDVVFGAGEYAPESAEGQRLLAHELAHVAQGGAFVRRQPDDEAEKEMPDFGPKQGSLLSIDYSGPEVCGGRPCFSDEQIYLAAGYNAEVEAFEAEATKNTTPIGVVGPFVVAVGTTRGSAPAKTPPSGIPKIVQGSNDPAVLYHTYSMVNRTGQQGTGMGRGVLAGVDEITLVAHGNQQVVAVGTQHMPPRQLAQTLVDAGWQGGTLRLAACKTGICAAGNSFAQTLANELKALSAESVVIAPKANVQIFGGIHGVPQIQPPTPPGGQKPPLLPPGEGWEYFMAEERPGWQIERSGLKPGAWKSATVGAAKFAAIMALSYLHGRAVAERTQQETAATGFSEPGPTGDFLYDLGAWILDPTDEAGRSIPFSQRFEMSTWRWTMKEAADRKKPGEYYKCSWTTSDGEDSFGTPKYRKFYAKYRKGANGYWYTISCQDCEGKDFPPDLNKIIDPTISDEKIREYLELPIPWSDLA